MASNKTVAGGRGVGYQIPRNTLALLMLAQAAVVLPYLFQLSPWIVAVGLFCGFWRSGVYQGRWDYPRRWVKALLVVASVAAVALSGIELYSLEAAASLLILAFSLKLIEMKSRRDGFLVIFLAYFIIATRFLFEQSMGTALYQVLALVLVTAAMVSMNQVMTRVRPLESLRVAGVLVLQALPLTLVLFLFFPRIAPLWTVPLPSQSATGLSEQVTPGDVAQLSRSDELVFRAVFDGPVPGNAERYWRGLVYSRFADGTWSVGARLPDWDDEPPQAPGTAEALSYEVLLEPTQSRWLFALETPLAAPRGAVLTRDYRLVAGAPVLSVLRYRATAWPELRPEAVPELAPSLMARETALPASGNRRTRQLAAELWADSGGSAGAFVAAVQRRIRNGDYYYTLAPPAVPAPDSIDRFWFDTRRGFCVHYAGALVFMLRSVGVPARMVGGYQGGEVNPLTGHVMVRQYDAHAWVEYWVPGQGWRRADPTAAVAPARIEQGLDAALSAEERENLGGLVSGIMRGRFEGAALLRDLLYWGDSLEHRWNLWVLGYDDQFQGDFLEDLLGEVTPARVVAAVLGAGGASLGAVALTLFWRRRATHRHPAERVFARFCRRLARYGWPRHPAEPPGTFLRRLAASSGHPEAAEPLIADLERVLYNPASRWGSRDLRQIRRQLARLQLRLAFGTAR